MADFTVNQDPKSLQQLNGYVGSLADKEYLQPEAAIGQLRTRLGTVGLDFKVPSIDGDKGSAVAEVTQFGGRYGKTTDSILGIFNFIIWFYWTS